MYSMFLWGTGMLSHTVHKFIVPDPDGSELIRIFLMIRVLKVRIRPFKNLSDLNDGFDKVLEEPDQKRQY